MNRIARASTLPLLAACLWLPAAPVRAAVCTLDNRPAATLLLPYFEVDLADPAGLTTLVAINNASASSSTST